MDRHLPQQHEPEPRAPGADSVGFEDDEDEIDAHPGDESLMEALSEHISRDPETDEILGCNDDFRLTLETLRRHDQEDVADEVLALLRTQGANCDCEVLLNSKIDLIFLEDEDDELDDEDEAEDEMAT
jgi:hypothetical protein